MLDLDSEIERQLPTLKIVLVKTNFEKCQKSKSTTTMTTTTTAKTTAMTTAMTTVCSQSVLDFVPIERTNPGLSLPSLDDIDDTGNYISYLYPESHFSLPLNIGAVPSFYLVSALGVNISGFIRIKSLFSYKYFLSIDHIIMRFNFRT